MTRRPLPVSASSEAPVPRPAAIEHVWTAGVKGIRWADLIGLGTSPFRMIGLRTAPGSGTGTPRAPGVRDAYRREDRRNGAIGNDLAEIIPHPVLSAVPVPGTRGRPQPDHPEGRCASRSIRPRMPLPHPLSIRVRFAAGPRPELRSSETGSGRRVISMNCRKRRASPDRQAPRPTGRVRIASGDGSTGSLPVKAARTLGGEARQAVVATVPGQRAGIRDRTHRIDPAASIDRKQNQVRTSPCPAAAARLDRAATAVKSSIRADIVAKPRLRPST